MRLSIKRDFRYRNLSFFLAIFFDNNLDNFSQKRIDMMSEISYNDSRTDTVSKKGGDLMDHYDLRKEEIIEACKELYDQYHFKDITMKLISEKTTFSRPSIYNYFETKEEIFLALFQKEYENWQKELDEIREKNESLSKEEFASFLAHTLENKERLLKLLSMNMYDLEENSRIERLIEFKTAYKNAVHSIKLCLNKFFKEMTDQETTEFIYTFFPFMFGIYPYVVVTKKQKEAMEKAGIQYKYYSLYELCFIGIKKLLK